MAPSSDVILERLLSLHPKKIDLSLGRTQALLAKLGDPQKHLPPVIHVAGTNGKGSTVAFLRAMLEAAGKRVHVYTSPHLVRFHERIRLAAEGGGKLVDEPRLAATLEACEIANAGAPITFFEITTAAAFKLFAETPADVVLLEVGLGGRFDSTNVIDKPAATVITPVSMDHVEFLGPTVAAIAGEKAGILQRGVPAIFAAQVPEALAVIEAEAERLRAPFWLEGLDFFAREEHGRLVYEGPDLLLDLPLPRLAGRHQQQNAAVAIATVTRLWPGFPTDAIERGILGAEWPARLQKLTTGALVDRAPAPAEIWLDGGHNEAGGQVLASAMADLEERNPRPLVLICGTLAAKNTGGFLESFRGLAQEVLAVPIPGDHAGRSAEDVATLARHAGLASAAVGSVAEALDYLAARNWQAPPRILIAGSLYLAGSVLAENGTEVA